MQVEFKTNIKSEFGDSSMADEDQVTYMRAKKKVATLATAKRIEKQIGHKKWNLLLKIKFNYFINRNETCICFRGNLLISNRNQFVDMQKWF